MSETCCEKCGSTDLASGGLEGDALTLDEASTLNRVINRGGRVACTVCLGCGAVFDFRGDPAGLAKMLGR